MDLQVNTNVEKEHISTIFKTEYRGSIGCNFNADSDNVGKQKETELWDTRWVAMLSASRSLASEAWVTDAGRSVRYANR